MKEQKKTRRKARLDIAYSVLRSSRVPASGGDHLQQGPGPIDAATLAGEVAVDPVVAARAGAGAGIGRREGGGGAVGPEGIALVRRHVDIQDQVARLFGEYDHVYTDSYTHLRAHETKAK